MDEPRAGEEKPRYKINKRVLKRLPPETVMIDSVTLAKLLRRSVKWVVLCREFIFGAQRCGRRWRFNLELIMNRLCMGQDIVLRGRMKMKKRRSKGDVWS